MILDFFGDKTNSLFDFWSLIHISTGIVFSSFLFDFIKSKLPNGLKNPQIIVFFGRPFEIWIDTLLVFLAAYLWEFSEYFMESGVLGQDVSFWFHGVEFWGNKFIADPFLVYLGYKFGRSFYFRFEKADAPESKSEPQHLIFFSRNNLWTLMPVYQQSASSFLTLKGSTCSFIIIWLTINIFSPHSMYLQQILLR